TEPAPGIVPSPRVGDQYRQRREEVTERAYQQPEWPGPDMVPRGGGRSGPAWWIWATLVGMVVVLGASAAWLASEVLRGGGKTDGKAQAGKPEEKAKEKELERPTEKKVEEVKKDAEWPKQITNSIGMKLVRIPAGTFLMGSPGGEPGRNN